jgi:hypothetical protein
MTYTKHMQALQNEHNETKKSIACSVKWPLVIYFAASVHESNEQIEFKRPQ